MKLDQIKKVQDELEKLKNADDGTLQALCEDSVERRLKWYEENCTSFLFIDRDDPLESAYQLLLARFKIFTEEMPVVMRTDREIVFHSKNFCPTLEACKILGLDTREICKKLNERSTDLLVKQLDGRLKFSRNYEKLRPHSEYCEERISLEDGGEPK